jgi:uncharacterized protein (DUF433 family)
MTTASSNPVVMAFTEEQVTRLAHITKRQLRHWDNTGFFAPSLGFEDRARPYSRLYSFRDVVCLRVLNALRNESKVPLQQLRQVKEKLIGLGEHLWSQTTLYVLNKRVVFENPETGKREDVITQQGVLEIPLRVVTGRVEEEIERLRERDATQVGKFERKRGVVHNELVVAGTRIPVRSIRAFAEAGYSPEDIQKQYPTLTLDDIRAASAFEAA